MNSKEPAIVYGRRPVLEALESGPVSKILMAKGMEKRGVDEIRTLARKKKVPFQMVERRKLDQLVEGNHQGVVAYVSSPSLSSYSQLLNEVASSQTKVPCLIFLDGIQDPQNLGGILRTAVFMGVQGVVIPKWRAAAVTSAVVRASAGAARRIAVAQVSNLSNALREARKKGLWLVGADMDGEDLKKSQVPRPFGLVLGSEGEGLHRLVRENCDLLVRIDGAKGRGTIDSLNVSVACGILLHHFQN